MIMVRHTIRRRDKSVFVMAFIGMVLGVLILMLESMMRFPGVDGPFIIVLGTVMMWFAWCKYNEVDDGRR